MALLGAALLEEAGEKRPLRGPPPQGCCSSAVLARLVTSVTALAEGYDIGCINGALVLLRSELELSSLQLGALVGSVYFALALGAPMAGMLADAVGRKIALGVTYMLLFAGTLTMALAHGFTMLLVGRCLQGVGLGAGLCVVTAYIAEVSPKSRRARFVCLEELFLVCGIATGYCFNYLLEEVPHSWRWMFGIGALPVLVAGGMLCLPQLPESPRWMLLTEHKGRAEATLAGIVGEEEARQMLLEWAEQTEQSAASWPEVLCPGAGGRRNALVVGLGVMVAQIATGITAIALYMGTILSREMSHSNAFLVSTFFGVARVATLAVSIFCLLDRVGRRPLFLASIAGMTVCMAALSALYAHDGAHLNMKLVAFAGFGMSFALGMGPATYVYVAEVFETRVRTKGISVGLFITRTMTGVIMTIFPFLDEAIGIAGIFFLFFLINIAAAVFLFFFVPETKNLSLESLSKVFEGSLLLTHKRR